MKSKQAKNSLQKIDEAIKDIENFSNISELEKSYLAKFLVVFICGIYEEVIENIVNERINEHKSIETSNYIRESLHNTFRNPNMQNIKRLLGKFNNKWKLEVENLPQDAQTAINNIVNDKNSLAHGNDVSITLRDVVQYYADSRAVINKIDDMLLY